MDNLPSRPKWEGGQYDGDENKRQEALRLAMELGSDFIDVELKVQLLTICRIYFNVENVLSSYASEQVIELFNLLLKVAQEFFSSIQGKKPEKVKIIVSSHNYDRTPTVEEIGELVARIQATGADIVKIATTALDITDNARMFQVLVHSQVSNLICYYGTL